MEDSRWRKCDQLNIPHYLESSDTCIYAREHLEGGYEASDSNQLIFNYKKSLRYRKSKQWYWKIKAIDKFAEELWDLRFPENSVLIPAPTSNPRNHPENDSRIDETLIKLQGFRTDLQIEKIIDVVKPIPAAHNQEGMRNPDEIIKALKWIGFSSNIKQTPERLFLIDDVVTTGGHFKACKNFILQQISETEIIGIFWAIHVFHNDNL